MPRVRIWFAGLLLLSSTVLVAGTGWGETEGESSLRRDVDTLSSEAFEGRGTGTAGLERAVAYLENRFAEAGLRPPSPSGYRRSFSGPDGTELFNLVGVLGESSGGHVIVGAHYDHLGFGERGDANEGKLHPGADDNASGVAVLLECARRLAEEDELAHAVVFVAFAGEEKGLLGSTHYVDNPVMPLGECIAMVNLDTVGRLAEGKLIVFGANTAAQLTHVLRGINYGFGFNLELPETDVGGSDQTSFVRKGVPAVQIFTGPNPDYHRPGDTADKIDFVGLERVAGFATELLVYLAEREEPMAFVPPGAEKAAASAVPSGGSARRVSFGSIPDFNYDGEGVRLSGVIPGSPAENAGLKEGDLLVEFAGVSVSDLASFSSVLKSLSPGDEVDVVFLRDGARHTVTVKVIERK